MQIQLIRNATLRLRYGGKTLLIDPDLAKRHAREPLAGIEENPTVDLRMRAGEVMTDIQAVLVSHLHQDHFDASAQELLPKELPLLCHPEIDEKIVGLGFKDVRPLQQALVWEGITIIPTPAQHGSGVWAERLAPVCGFVLQAEGEPSVYWCGDTILYPAVMDVIAKYQPEVIITHSGGAHLGESGPIIMDIEQTLTLVKEVPEATVVAVHLEALDHCPVKRSYLAAAAEAAGVSKRLKILEDGEALVL